MSGKVPLEGGTHRVGLSCSLARLPHQLATHLERERNAGEKEQVGMGSRLQNTSEEEQVGMT